MAITTKSELKSYCFRELGSPVINIEVDGAQADDRIDDAVQFFTERHYDGTEVAYFHKTISHTDALNGYFSVPSDYNALIEVMSPGANGSSTENLDNYQYHFMSNLNMMMAANGGNIGSISNYYIQMSHLNLITGLLSTDNNFDYNSTTNIVRPKWPLNSIGSGNFLKDASDLTTTNWTKVNAGVTPNQPDPNGKTEAFSVYATGAGTFSLGQTISTTRYVRGTYTAIVGVRKGTYAGTLQITVADSQGNVYSTKTITPSALWKEEFIEVNFPNTSGADIVLKIEGTAVGAEHFDIFAPFLYLNRTIVLHGSRSVDPTNSGMYNNRWLKQYSTALIKRQWGSNLKKMSGIQMPGGVELNGQTIFDEAETEIERLIEQFALDFQEPPSGGWY